LLIVAVVVGPWSAFHYMIAGKHIEVDLQRANESS